MRYFLLRPYSAGCNSTSDADWTNNTIYKLRYKFDFWKNDVLLSSSPTWIITVPAKHAVQSAKLTGVHFDSVEVSKSELFDQLHPNQELPSFAWMKVDGKAGRDDFGIVRKTKLVISEHALALLRTLGIPNARVSDYTE
jgi:hypothetical protein